MWKEQFRDLHSGVLSTQSQNLSLHSFTSPPNQHRPSQHHFSSDHLPLSAAWSNLFLLLSHLALLPNSSQKKKKLETSEPIIPLYLFTFHCLQNKTHIPGLVYKALWQLAAASLLDLILCPSFLHLPFSSHVVLSFSGTDLLAFAQLFPLPWMLFPLRCLWQAPTH